MNKDAKKILKISLTSFFFLLVIIFIFFNTKDLIFGVKIKKVNIIDNEKFSDNITKITGIAKNAVKLSLNDREISIDEKGNFEETIALLLGYNLVNIKAKDKFGNSDEKNYKLIY